ncbi:maleylpyruvate isomerase N-terminal domain-containing protein [Nonomuraea sp. 3N208]|uniref:maleylpyruvate isomerase N-terminal domain-containing protein n=1 Tax=Nonomuraea sp. 3N208 TaxID=3457421 RepID=UPI003FCE4710
MEYRRFLDCLAADFARLRAVAPTDLAAAVPSCPGWTVADLTHHVGQVYLHRIDAELGTGQPVAPMPDDLAVDGVDELLKVFVAYSVAEWGDDFTDILAGSPGRTYAVRTDGAAWTMRTGPGLFTVEDGTGDDAADVTVSGPPAAVLRWLWNREGGGEPGSVTVEGAPEAVEELQRCVVMATQ